RRHRAGVGRDVGEDVQRRCTRAAGHPGLADACGAAAQWRHRADLRRRVRVMTVHEEIQADIVSDVAAEERPETQPGQDAVSASRRG
ncbi:hypothetical protein DKX15_18795, partial [Enterococcus faecium]